jgi:hypothetical protein
MATTHEYKEQLEDLFQRAYDDGIHVWIESEIDNGYPAPIVDNTSITFVDRDGDSPAAVVDDLLYYVGTI